MADAVLYTTYDRLGDELLDEGEAGSPPVHLQSCMLLQQFYWPLDGCVDWTKAFLPHGHRVVNWNKETTTPAPTRHPPDNLPKVAEVVAPPATPTRALPVRAGHPRMSGSTAVQVDT